jgi:hypothetical protein
MFTTDRYDTITTQLAVSSVAQLSKYRHRRRKYHGLIQFLIYAGPARKVLGPCMTENIRVIEERTNL